MNDLIFEFDLFSSALGHLTSSIQLGFISGTLLFAFFTISDRFSPSRVFVVSALCGAVFKLLLVLQYNNMAMLVVWRFLTGFFLAGIYPVGMKIAADYFEKGLGRILGMLVGALVLGTALPHLLKALNTESPWRWVVYGTSILSVLGGIMVFICIPDGPYRKPSMRFDFSAVFKVFRNAKFRSAATGYFGHMWELYSFWAFVPLLLAIHFSEYPQADSFISFGAFIIISAGSLSCVLGGIISQKLGLKNTAAGALFISGICCLFSPWYFKLSISSVAFLYLLIWGVAVIADSPLFSTLVANNAPKEFKGTALTIVNCIGFSITIVSLELMTLFIEILEVKFVFLILAIGPLFGLVGLLKKSR